MRISDWSSDVCSSDLPAGLAPDASVALWPDRYLTAPEGLTERVVQRSDDPQASDRMLEHIVRPRLDLFRPANPNGAAMILAPGGGYRYVGVGRASCRERVGQYVLILGVPGTIK